MADKSWKAFERRIAKLFGCTRRGPIFRSPDGGTDDLTHEWYAVECKLLSKPAFGQLLDAAKQAELAGKGRQPIAIVKRKGDRMEDALVIQRLATFKAWHL